MKRIVAAIDHSEASLRALDTAAELAATFDAELILLTVVRDLGAPDPGLAAYARMEGVRDPMPFSTIDAGVGYRLARTEVRLDARNLGNRRDPVSESEFGDAQYYRMPARSVRAGLALHY